MSSSGEEEEEDKEEVEEEKSSLSSSSAPIDLTREEEEKEEEEEEPQPLAWRLLKRAAEKRCEEKQSQREEEDQQTLEAEPTPLEESSFLRNDFDDEEEDDDDDAQRERGGGLGAPLSSPPDYSTKTDQELAKELAKFGMKRLGSRTAMIDCLMNIWTEKMVERGDGAAYSQRLEEELLSLSQRDQNACNNNNAMNAVGVGMATKKRKNATTSTLRGGGERKPRTDEEEKEEEEEQEKEEDETDERALDAKLTAFLKSSRDVYASILRMEPLDLDEVKTLCQNGLRMKCISKVKLAKYFESKGVAVRHKSNHAAKVRKRTKKNTLSSNISPIREELL